MPNPIDLDDVATDLLRLADQYNAEAVAQVARMIWPETPTLDDELTELVVDDCVDEIRSDALAFAVRLGGTPNEVLRAAVLFRAFLSGITDPDSPAGGT